MERIYVLGSIAVIAALVGTAALFILVLPERRRRFLPLPLKVLADFLNMRTLLLEGILKAVYVFLNLLTVIGGVFAMFSVPNGFAVGIVAILAGPLVLRVLHETVMLRLMTLKTLQEIRAALPDREGEASAFAEEERRSPRRERSGRRGRTWRDAEPEAAGGDGQQVQTQQSTVGQTVWTVQTPPQGAPQGYPQYPQGYAQGYPQAPQGVPQAGAYPAYGTAPVQPYGGEGGPSRRGRR